MFIKLRMFAIIVGVFIGGVVVFFTGLNDLNRAHQLSSRGKTATVVRIVSLPGNADEVHFITEDGTRQVERMTVPTSLRGRLLSHEEVTFVYLPDDPSVNRWDSEKKERGVLALMGLVILGLGVLLYKWLVR